MKVETGEVFWVGEDVLLERVVAELHKDEKVNSAAFAADIQKSKLTSATAVS